MNQQNLRSLTLFDLLARKWKCNASVEELRFSEDGSAAAFACADGTVAIATMSDAEPPEARIRVSGDLGQATIRPREKPPEPLATSRSLHDRAPPLATLAGSNFLVGSFEGAVLQLDVSGSIMGTRVNVGARVVGMDHVIGRDLTVITDGANVFLSRGLGECVNFLPRNDAEVISVRFSPSGAYLAVAHADSLSIWRMNGSGEPICTFGLLETPSALFWNEDEQWLACALRSGGFLLVDISNCRAGTVTGFPAGTRDISWSAPANVLLASGAFRIAGWSMNTPPLDGDMAGALVSGRAGLVLVESVAAHPGKPLAAAGYSNGQIVIAQIGGRDELLVKPSGGAAIVLRWSADGSHLATGTAEGDIGIITFPPQLFR